MHLLGGNGKGHLGQGLLDLALLLAILRNSEVTYFSTDVGNNPNDRFNGQETFLDDGPLLGITTTSPHYFQDSAWLGPGYSQKSASIHYDNIMDEYDNIMRDIRSRPPVLFTLPATEDTAEITNNDIQPQPNLEAGRDVITMVLSISNPEPGLSNAGPVQMPSRAAMHLEGAVGGVAADYFSANESFDLFNPFIPSNMGDEEIDNLMLSSLHSDEGTPNDSLVDNLSDVRWQQYISGYDSMTHQGPLAMCGCSTNGTLNWGSGSDILSEAIYSSELFLPRVTNEQTRNASQDPYSQRALDGSLNQGTSENATDLVMSSRLEVLNSNLWESQNHELELFPSLPPPSYEEVMARDAHRYADAMHDHNYFNRVSATGGRQTQRGYAIRSRQEVSTRVITAAPRTRHISEASVTAAENEVCDSGASDAASDISERSGRRITIGSDSGVEGDVVQSQMEFESRLSTPEVTSHDGFEIEAMDSTYYLTLSNDVRLRREVILCN